MKTTFSFLLTVLVLIGQAQHKKVCITVDDLPTVTYGVGGYDHRVQITSGIIEAFKTFAVPAIGYVNETKLYQKGKLDSLEVDLLEMWLSNGLELGNHTYAHLNFHEVAFEEFTSNILKGERVSKPLAEKYQSAYKYFRHPYLRIGLRQSQVDSLQSFLATHGYIESPVTIDNDDYLFAVAYARAYKKNDRELMERISKDYIDYMEEKLVYFENQSIRLFGRPMDQTLLIHANYLNARHLKDLLKMYQDQGYAFVSQSEVLKDETYQHPVTKHGDWGISWIDRWAISEGKSGDFFKGDPVVPGYIRE
ncbi:MAG: polysaccharide deacetylase family protein [Cyclobacteriaceae bacterium]